ncbi:MBL fold metallo-hydrolase [Cyanobium sp. ATX 6A2]|uniref:MBL fold metallo-hydrolase n=1 Tax=Cyanobium sp. ATX 6A2 TaxID=2823700 RepID=UPI0020CF2BE5|nr:MBL fold metallo-hydrolase [Cyanobium sp. ATX 6A2]MCP9886791.1 MBL fold metallo-hydrolase [Cyanobium sp. ATX 6A2]
MLQPVPLDPGRPPQQVRRGLWLFAPNRDTGGGSSWLVEAAALGCDGPGGDGLGAGDLLIDCPAWNQANRDWLRRRSGHGTIVFTSREGHGRCRRFQEALGWDVLVQEQEAYLLPGVERVSSFAAEHSLAPGVRLLWTPGPTPGSCVLHLAVGELDGLFCGRLLQPVAPGRLQPLATARTFHWPRQIRSLERLRLWLPAGSPDWIACAGGLGALRGEKLVEGGAGLLAALDLPVPAAQTGLTA